MIIWEGTILLENPIFPYSSEFVSDDNSNFVDDYAKALLALQEFYNDYVTSASVALVQVTAFEYLFLLDRGEAFDMVKVSSNEGKAVANKVSSCDKLKLRDEK